MAETCPHKTTRALYAHTLTPLGAALSVSISVSVCPPPAVRDLRQSADSQVHRAVWRQRGCSRSLNEAPRRKQCPLATDSRCAGSLFQVSSRRWDSDSGPIPTAYAWEIPTTQHCTRQIGWKNCTPHSPGSVKEQAKREGSRPGPSTLETTNVAHDLLVRHQLHARNNNN